MNTKQKLKKTALVKAVRRDDPYLTLGAARVESDKFWRWGDDNLFPAALALMSRRSTTHRRIINDKADYISGKGFTFDPEVPLLGAFVAQVNGSGESLRQVCSKLSFDKSLFGNAFLEVVTDEKHSFLALYHQDASRCRVAKDFLHSPTIYKKRSSFCNKRTMLSAILTIFCFGIRKRASAMITVRLHNGIQFFPARCVNISLSADICRFQQTVAYKTAWRKYTFQKIIQDGYGFELQSVLPLFQIQPLSYLL